jgi:KTSC domain-containing protein
VITLTPVESSNVFALGYDPATKRLQVQFRSSRDARMPGQTYEYRNVPPETNEALMNSESKGAFVNQRIKGHFDGVRIEAAPAVAQARAVGDRVWRGDEADESP